MTLVFREVYDMIKYKLNINKGLWHVNFYTVDVKGKNKRKQLSTGIKAYDGNGKKINKRNADDKAEGDSCEIRRDC